MIYLDVTSFTARPELGDKIVRVIQEKIIEELKDTFPDVRYRDNSDLMDTLSAIREATGEKFFFIIDEWDAICREFPDRRKMKGDASGVLQQSLTSMLCCSVVCSRHRSLMKFLPEHTSQVFCQ